MSTPSKYLGHDILIVSTGWNGLGRVDKTETFAINVSNGNIGLQQCNDQNIQARLKVSRATGGNLKFIHRENGDYEGPVPIMCGGIDEIGETLVDCYSLIQVNRKPIVRMTTDRSDAASVVVRNGTVLWVTGGHSIHYSGLDSTDWIYHDALSDALEAKEGPRLAQKTFHHCIQMMDSRTAILYGGYKAIPNSWTIDISEDSISGSQSTADNNRWIPGPSMKTGRHSHVCGVVRDSVTGNKIVVAAGGRDYEDIITDQVELIFIDSDNVFDSVISDEDNHFAPALSDWLHGPQLPFTLSQASSATTHHQTKLFVAGGKSADFARIPSGISKFILTFHCANLECKWTKQCLELRSRRSSPVAYVLPPFVEQIGSGEAESVIEEPGCDITGGMCPIK